MTQVIQELMNGGVVTKRHSTMLKEGELQQGDDVVYRRFDPAVHRAPGRTEYNSSALGSPSLIKGLSFLGFNNNPDLLLAYVDTLLYTSPFTALTGTFTSIPTTLVGALPDDAGDPEIMTTQPYGGRYYILVTGTAPRRLGYVNPSLTVDSATTVSSLNTLTTTTAKGFKNVIVGQSVSGTGGTGTIAAGARVLSKTTDLIVVLDTNGTNGTITTVTFSDTAFIQPQYAGMLPVTESPTVATVAGSWSTTSDMGAGVYWFLYTEMLIPGAIDDINSGFIEGGFTAQTPDGKPGMVAGTIATPASESISVTRGAIVNTAANQANVATHWQVYMSDRQADATLRPSLATFKRIGGPIPIATSSFTFIDSNLNQGPRNPTASASLTGFTLPNNVSGSFTQHDGSTAGFPLGAPRGMILQTFGLVSSGAVNGGTLTGSETVKGVVVRVLGRKTHGDVVFKTSTKRSERREYNLNDWGTYTLGSNTDTWAETWVAADFVNGTFSMEFRGAGGIGGGEIDGVDVQVFYTGTSVNRNGVPLRTVTYRSQVGVTITDTTNLPPPSATTGDTFQGSLVLNDQTDQSLIRFSLPGVADAFPKPYFIRFNLPRKNFVTNIKRVGQVLLVGMRDTIQRVNYLPTELDTSFQEGLAHEDLASDHGITGPHAAVLFDMFGGGVVLAYVAYDGIHLTDGITTRYLNLDLDWENTVDVVNLGTCVLRNYPQENWLVMFYAPFGTTHGKNTRALIFPYSPDKVKEGGTLPAIGPLKVSGRSATMGATVSGTTSGKTYLLTGHQATGKVYVEDQGLTLPASYTVANSAGTEAAITIVPTVKTRRVYNSGIGRQSRESRTYAMVSPFGSTFTVASCTTVEGSPNVTSSAGFGSVLKGMRATAVGLPMDNVVKTVTNSSNIVMSSNATASGTVTITFDTGTLGLTVAGQDINETLTVFGKTYQSTTTGGLISWQPDNMKEAFELTFSKVILPDDSTGDLSTGMRIHYFAYMADDMSQETHRS